jgi:hypothetical protein
MFYPFTLTNLSHIWKLQDLKWNCQVLSLSTEQGEFLHNVSTGHNSGMVVDKGQTVNIDCFKFGRMQLFGFKSGPPRFTDGEMLVHVSYRIALWHPQRTMRFTWMGKASNPQWIRGDFAN